MIKRLFWNKRTRSYVLHLLQLLPIKRKRILCICWGGDKYNCNPRAITDAILSSIVNTQFEIYYAFKQPSRFSSVLPQGIKSIELGSLTYFYILATSHYIISNTRIVGINWPFPKRIDQIYIQTQHGGHGIKKVEFDAIEALSEEYMASAKEDTKRTDLMLSDSVYWTNIYRTAYRYEGEILQMGLPRNDLFLSSEVYKEKVKGDVIAYIKDNNPGCIVDENSRFLIYTPTFRANNRKDIYGFNFDEIISVLGKRFGGQWYVLISSHPNMLSFYNDIYDFSNNRLIDVGTYPDLQELLITADALITDYSSAEMDFSLTGRPIFQLIKDYREYERETYIDPRTLPFPFAENDEQLKEAILYFDDVKYNQDLSIFNKNVIGLCETGRASKAVVEWMVNHL